jgi:hypothetical protein
MPLIIGTTVKDVLRAFVNLKETRTSQFVRSTSVDNIQVDNPKWKHSVSYKWLKVSLFVVYFLVYHARFYIFRYFFFLVLFKNYD